MLAVGSSIKMPLGGSGSSRGATCHQVDSLAVPTLIGVWIDIYPAARLRGPSDVRQSFLVGLHFPYPSRRLTKSSPIMKASTCLLALALSLLISTLNASEEPGVPSQRLQYQFASRAVEGRCYRCTWSSVVT